MSLTTRCAKKHAKARRRRYRTAQERLARDQRQAQHAAAALQQALNDLGLPEDLVTEIEARLSSQRKLLGKIVGMMCPPLFGCRTNQWC
jgi:DNA repair ATPase RecN